MWWLRLTWLIEDACRVLKHKWYKAITMDAFWILMHLFYIPLLCYISQIQPAESQKLVIVLDVSGSMVSSPNENRLPRYEFSTYISCMLVYLPGLGQQPLVLWSLTLTTRLHWVLSPSPLMQLRLVLASQDAPEVMFATHSLSEEDEDEIYLVIKVIKS